MNVIEIENLTKTYENGVKALDGLSLSVRQGSVFGFLGLNGAGKTTTIRILAGLAAKDSGSVRLFGTPLEEHSIDVKMRVGFVLDEPLYFDWMTVRDYLVFLGAMYRLTGDETTARVQELLEFFELADKADEQIKHFSTGMKKKVSLAAAILHAPDLVVLDEPLEGIDAVAGGAIKETLSMMASRGTTIFITSHVMETVEKLCDEIAIIKSGRLLLQCPTAQIREQTMKSQSGETYGSLEELFIDVVSEKLHRKRLSYLTGGIQS